LKRACEGQERPRTLLARINAIVRIVDELIGVADIQTAEGLI